MGAVDVFCMNAGDCEFSYAKNSTHQQSVILKAQKLLEESVKEYGANGFPECFKLVDLGCSSGPNTLLVVTNIVNIVDEVCRQKNNKDIIIKTPETQVFLNDLPDNDFNTIFKMLPSFYSNNKSAAAKKCFVSGVPGSFYTRLFPTKSIHFVHSSCGVHWLSQVPEKLEDNKGKIYLSKTSPSSVYEAYLNQYKKDFSKFLCLRSEEVVPNGRMVLTHLGRSSADPTIKDCFRVYELLAKSLQDMSAEGLCEDKDIDTFNVPLYTPSVDEVKAIINDEGSFSIDQLESYEANCDMRDDELESVADMEESGNIIANTSRAIFESMLAHHFGNQNSFMDKLFERFARHLSRERTKCFYIMISLTRNNH